MSMKRNNLVVLVIVSLGISTAVWATPALVSPYDTAWELKTVSLDPSWNTTGITAAGQNSNGYYVIANKYKRSCDANPAIWVADASGNYVNHQYEANVAPNAKDIVMGQNAAWIVTGGSGSQLNKWSYSDLTSGSSTMVVSASDGGYWTEMILDEANNTGYINDRTNKKIVQVNLTTGAVSDWAVHGVDNSFGLSWGPDGAGGDMYLSAAGNNISSVFKIAFSTKDVTMLHDKGWYWDGGAGGLEYLSSQDAFYCPMMNHWSTHENSVMEIAASTGYDMVEISKPWTRGQQFLGLSNGTAGRGPGLLIADWNTLYEQNPIPEPATIGLTLLGLAGLIRRKK